MKYPVGKINELSPGSKKVVHVDNKSIVLICSQENQFYAVRNACPHQGAELACGSVSGTMVPSEVGHYVYGKENQIIRCPWHGFEYDITTGCAVHDEADAKVKNYEVIVEDDTILINI